MKGTIFIHPAGLCGLISVMHPIPTTTTKGTIIIYLVRLWVLIYAIHPILIPTAKGIDLTPTMKQITTICLAMLYELCA
jgi:hypothetical protein